jgi:hypothetical protein
MVDALVKYFIIRLIHSMYVLLPQAHFSFFLIPFLHRISLLAQFCFVSFSSI